MLKKGYKHTIETKQKIRESQLKNPTRYWFNKKRSEETKRKISESHKGKKLSETTKLKLKGKIPWNKGIKELYHHPEETKRKISLTMVGQKKTLEHSNNIRKGQLGKIISLEIREKIRQSLLGRKNPEHSIRMKGRVQSMKSRLKRSNAMKGEKNHSWKGGITPENYKIRHSIEFRLWREAVFARDNWTCQKTKIKGGKLNPHHIQNFSQYPKLRTSIENGITLSETAHKEFHKKYGIKNNNKEQIIEFLNN